MKPQQLLAAGLAVGACLIQGLHADTGTSSPLFDFDSVTIGGFLSQGYLYSSGNNFPTADSGGTWDFREMAVNASAPIGSHIRVGAQGFAESFGNIGDDKIILDWAVLDYNFSQQFGIRVGRVKYPKGLYGEALDLDVTRPFVLLPSAVYNPVLRDFSASFNGGMAYGTVNAGKSSFDYKVFYGYIPIGPENGVAEFYNNGASLYGGNGVTALAMEHVAGSQFIWNTPIDGLRFAHSYSYYHDLTTDGPFSAVPTLNLRTVIQHFYWSTLSAEYQRGDWTLASEWQRTGGTDLTGIVVPIVTFTDDVGWDAWYVSVARRFARKFEAGTYFSSIHDRFPGSSGDTPADHRHDAVASLRYDYNEHLLFKIEVQSIDGTYQMFNTPRIPNPPATLKNHTTVLAAKTTLSF